MSRARIPFSKVLWINAFGSLWLNPLVRDISTRSIRLHSHRWSVPHYPKKLSLNWRASGTISKDAFEKTTIAFLRAASGSR